ncbi:NB-ARC domain-containing protein [Gloeocapsopsis dulcis]|uniref:Uncharacterized protein n=1 Tax=Gloeocapsopsis dulcis AAB1 = 1H9 TaxID=1433147 RepID=A0A6N8G1R3_9CHRO|nr:NB-ARC domain-containing protein [Gloeocapsopsis dulcis]MUL39131.1 hypothetical protein [Gloeocapsopsis dulcis AAB1 = 1H9]WNN90732.1 NB-ARC domain-containing protein [Gloeocapsopsis dulcis]
MTVEEALDIIEQAIEPQQLNKIQRLVLQHVWQQQSYTEIAQATSYDFGYIKDTGSKLWQILSEAFGEKVTKQNIHVVLKQRCKQNLRFKELTYKTQLPQSQDWGEAVDTSIFYGRLQELATLEQWIVQDHCRLVAILGMGGVGKTSLSVKLAEQLQFEFLFWRSLRDAPPYNEFLTTLLQFFSQDNNALPETESAKLAQLQEHLRTARCLIVLDNFDAVFAPGQRIGVYRDGYAGYGELLQRIGEARHQSCLVITSRDKPLEIATLQGESLPVRELVLPGLEAIAAYELLAKKGVKGSQEELNHLINCYQGNPLALKIIATSIYDIFAGKISDFLNQGVAVFNGIRHLLKSQIERLSAPEKHIMYWLAINREPVNVSELLGDIFPSVSPAVLLETLESLRGRSLIERTAEGFTQQPVVMEYMTEQLITQVSAELVGSSQNSTHCLRHYAVMKATAKDYVRESQIRIIVKPILTQAIAHLGTPQALTTQLNKLLGQLRTQNFEPIGYAIGNLLNLFNHLSVDLTGFDFSHFPIWQAYLANVKLQHVNFAYADLAKAVFAETFGGVSSVAFSPNGHLLATSDTSGEVQIWEIASGRQLNAFKADIAWTWAIAFSPNGQVLASAGDDYIVKIWDVKTGRLLQQLQGHTNTISTIAFHPHGQILASCSQDQTIRLWQVDNFWKNVSCRILQEHQARVWSVAFSPDGRTLVSGSEDQTLKLWNVETGTCWQTLCGHSRWVKAVAVSPDGKTIASGSFDGAIKLWSLATGQCLHTWQGHQTTVTTIAFNPDGDLLASASYDQTVKVWHVVTKKCLNTLQEHHNRVWSVAFSPDGQYLASGGDDHAARLCHLKSGQCAKAWKGHNNSILSLALSLTQPLLATGHEDQTVKLWNLQTGKVTKTLRGHTNRIWSVAIAPPQLEIMASGSADSTIKLWQPQTGQCLKTLHGHASWVWSVTFSPEGHQLASGSYDKTIKLWDVYSGECLKTLEEHAAAVVAVTYSPNGQWLASSSFDTTIKLWDAIAGNCLQTFTGHHNSVWAIAFSPDGQCLASCSYDQTVKLWDIHTGVCLQTFTGHQGPVVSLAFNTSGTQLASGSFDRTVKLWNTNTGECVHTHYGHTGLVSALAFQDLNCLDRGSEIAQPQQGILVSGSFDESIRFWNTDTGECLQTLHTLRPYDGMNITGVLSLTDSQKATLRALGAVEK